MSSWRIINEISRFPVSSSMHLAGNNAWILLFSAAGISTLDPRRVGGFFQPLLPDGVMAAQVTLTHLVVVRIHVGQPFDSGLRPALMAGGVPKIDFPSVPTEEFPEEAICPHPMRSD